MLRVREAGSGLTTRGHRRWSHRLAVALVMCSTVVLSRGTATSAQVRRRTGRPAAPAAARHPAFKAIFEPVGYPHDVDVIDVFFVGPETGWACGGRHSDAEDGGFIIATRDGGHTWSLEHGGPDATTRAVARVFFVDVTHGWAAQIDGTLLRTVDGSTWMPVGTIRPMSPFVFISPQKGFFLDGQAIQTTTDGGRTWSAGYRCAQTCEAQSIAFAPDRLTGYVATRALNGGTIGVIKTTDGGERWTPASVISDATASSASLSFSDSATGYLRTGDALMMTLDGGRTWHAVDAPNPGDAPKVVAAGPVGWMVGSHEFSYTLDGGKRWIARRVEFPAHVLSFAVPDAGTGYVAGSHGMIYRYRVVPFDYFVPRMLAIPGMTTFAPDS